MKVQGPVVVTETSCFIPPPIPFSLFQEVPKGRALLALLTHWKGRWVTLTGELIFPVFLCLILFLEQIFASYVRLINV